MNKYTLNSGMLHFWLPPKIILIMKLIIIIMTSFLLQVSAAGFAQRVTLKEKGASLKNVLQKVRTQTGYDFLFDFKVIRNAKQVDVDLNNAKLEDALDAIFKPQKLDYTIINKSVVVMPQETSLLDKVMSVFNDVDIRGIVLDQNGDPMMGATISVKGTNRRVVAGAGGAFFLSKVEEKATLVVTYLGYIPRQVKIKAGQVSITIQMELAENKMDDVVITGMGINRKKDSFTGATSTFSGEQLKAIGNKNILESLKTLDPSFIMVENNTQGANPNSLPTIEVRGKTTISTTTLNDQYSADPNQPLFILDGFESSLRVIYDLDINRIASVTLLKDAASTALYGSKAANGVVVVETKRPVAGELRISYSTDFSFDLPDFSSYNLMNSSEKLEFERLSGVYNNSPNFQWQSDSTYNAKLADIQRGVNTYWLSEPVQTGIAQRHSLRVSGGSNELLFGAGINYRNQQGVMKGSDRNTWGGNFDLTYRKSKINVTNSITISNLNSDDSPYGAFSSFSRANPYYRKYNADGSTPMFLDPGQTNTVNPLYNAGLFSIGKTNGFSFRNNLQANYTVSNSFRITGGISLGRDNGETISFVPPDHTSFAGIDPYQKGRYINAVSQSNFYSGNLMLSYAKVIGKNQFNANIRSDIQQTTQKSSGYSAVGFPYGTNGNPRFAYGYTPSGRPTASAITSNSVGFLGSLNYTYDQRFLFDATYRLDGSSAFGSNKQFKPFASAGLGWNVHREKFLADIKWIGLLKLRANIGYTGNQNLGQFTSTSVYTYLNGSNPFGQGLDMTSLGNPNLDWQKTLQKSYGLDYTILNNRISGYLEYFDKNTKPLIISASAAIPTSVGINSNYAINVGSLRTTGWAVNARFSPVYNLKERIIWTVGVSGQQTNSTYGGFGNSLDALNKLQLNNKSLIRYQDGSSPDDIYAVISHGIDPATGNELFEKKDGTLTFLYSTDDIVKVGNSRSTIEGVINNNFTYKSFSFGAYIRYRIGGDLFNSALYNKVENISSTNLIFNQDKRALYQRWQKPGDVSQFKSISLTSSTPMSSRFIEEDNHFIGESFSASWRVSEGWVRKLKMQSLSISLYVNDIFRIESVKSERGIDYPFSRSASISLNASF
jgi:TonB-linked SusC/RagA family outer membrane protein